ncbi:MAG: hypothetical protein A3F80_01090 [Candidatus Melainabacteria bacterium RIFCSPLOWO2_12_FULL_35_11]|nr:MAG: hypothetical protein A3F80_01090 [Candidatus Melainabacteria bacterium RIFCSPLOWO2_12_FULL_35_11]
MRRKSDRQHIINRKRFGKEIGYHEAYDSYMKLLTLMKAVYRPMTKEGLEKLEDRRKELGLKE